MLKCPLGWQNTLNCPLGWLKHDKLPTYVAKTCAKVTSWEPKRALKCPSVARTCCIFTPALQKVCARHCHAAQTLIVSVVPVITTADFYIEGLHVYLYSYIFQCVFGSLKL